MATEFFLQRGAEAEKNIETFFNVRVMSVRGLNPPQPKAFYTRDWAKDGVDYYIPPENLDDGRTVRFQASEMIMTLWIEDGVKTAVVKYDEFCAYIVGRLITYRDTLQGRVVELLYTKNDPKWYQFVGVGQVMAEITFLNPSGVVETYVAPAP
jgi:hypothetical protein